MGIDAGHDLRWVWRSLRARGWRGALTVLLLALALVANALVFAATDSIVLRPLPYEAPERLVSISRSEGRFEISFLTPDTLDAWRAQEDLFSEVHAYLQKTVFLTGDGVPELVETADVTPGLIDLLGVRPRWGRALRPGDERQASPHVVLVSERLARTRFGSPEAAVGQVLESSGVPLEIAGVMPRTFRFPYSGYEIWRAFDPRGPLAEGFGGASSLARLRPGVAPAVAAEAVAARGEAVSEATGSTGLAFKLAPWTPRDPQQGRQVLLVLLGAAGCLLLIVCANIASLELASALDRARIVSIQLALGASRWRLGRVALVEASVLVGVAALLAGLLAWTGADAVASLVAPSVGTAGLNPIDLDPRMGAFLVAAAALSWLLVSLPLAVFVARGSLTPFLKLEGRATSASGTGARVRRLLTVGQVGVAVALVIGAALYVRTYRALLELDTGFDTAGVVEVNLTIPPQVRWSAVESRALLDRVRAEPWVVAATAASSPTGNGERYSSDGIDTGGGRREETLSIRLDRVDAQYFTTLGIPLRAGRWLEPGEPETSVLVSESFADRYWPGGEAIGGHFRLSENRPFQEVVGVVGHVRGRFDGVAGRSPFSYTVYVAQQPPMPAPAPDAQAVAEANAGGFFSSPSFLVRLASVDRMADLVRLVRAEEPRYAIEVERVDGQYAAYFADRLLAARLVSAFGALAFVIAMAGLYAVMAFVVSARTREIGIRMALGARTTAVRRLVVGSALRMAGAGALVGAVAAAGASRWIAAQLFGVEPVDVVTYAAVVLVALATTVLAAWAPARRAMRVDPVVALRAE